MEVPTAAKPHAGTPACEGVGHRTCLANSSKHCRHRLCKKCCVARCVTARKAGDITDYTSWCPVHVAQDEFCRVGGAAGHGIVCVRHPTKGCVRGCCSVHCEKARVRSHSGTGDCKAHRRIKTQMKRALYFQVPQLCNGVGDCEARYDPRCSRKCCSAACCEESPGADCKVHAVKWPGEEGYVSHTIAMPAPAAKGTSGSDALDAELREALRVKQQTAQERGETLLDGVEDILHAPAKVKRKWLETEKKRAQKAI